MYKVINRFTDLRDGGRYERGDTFPRPGVTVPEERLEELSGCNNRRGIPLIVEQVTFDESPVPEKEEEPAVKKTRKAEKD